METTSSYQKTPTLERNKCTTALSELRLVEKAILLESIMHVVFVSLKVARIYIHECSNMARMQMDVKNEAACERAPLLTFSMHF